jgi:hypothetical protein
VLAGSPDALASSTARLAMRRVRPRAPTKQMGLFSILRILR